MTPDSFKFPLLVADHRGGGVRAGGGGGVRGRAGAPLGLCIHRDQRHERNEEVEGFYFHDVKITSLLKISRVQL